MTKSGEIPDVPWHPAHKVMRDSESVSADQQPPDSIIKKTFRSRRRGFRPPSSCAPVCASLVSANDE